MYEKVIRRFSSFSYLYPGWTKAMKNSQSEYVTVGSNER